jgi:hypothetical protein
MGLRVYGQCKANPCQREANQKSGKIIHLELI